MKKILVPTDFSNNAYSALFYVSKLFSGEPLQITILYSFNDEINARTSRVDAGRSEHIAEGLQTRSDEAGVGLLHKIKLATAKLPHTYHFVSTSARLSRTINKMIVSDGFDLVVMGTRGKTGTENILMGSTTINVLKKLKGCPLLIVPREVDFMVPSNIVYASDYNEFYQLSKLQPLLQLVRQYNSTIHLTHVGNKNDLKVNQEQNLAHFINDLTEFDSEIHWLQKTNNISETLNNFINTEKMDLLTLVYHKYNFIKQLFREPVVNRVGKNTHTPTLVIPIKK